jgi:F420-0:gamma-glutamyl ligase
MSYKVMEGGLCAHKDIESFENAKEIAEDYVREVDDAKMVEIVDQETGKRVCVGHVIFAVQWGQPDWS